MAIVTLIFPIARLFYALFYIFNVPIARSLACQAFEFLGLKLDELQNESHPVDQDIATVDSRVRVLVIHTQEAWAIAQSNANAAGPTLGPVRSLPLDR